MRNRIFKLLLILSLVILPGADIECDFEDGYFEVDWPDLDWHDDYYYESYWWDDWCYDCYWW